MLLSSAMQSHDRRRDPGNAQLLPSATKLGSVHLGVTEEDRAVEFYTRVVGLTKLPSKGDGISLGTLEGTELVTLYPGSSSPFPRGRTGLYHLALAVPDLRELARVEARFLSFGYPNYPTDHTVSKSLYLWDHDNNGIEVYTETPDDGAYFFNGENLVIQDKHGNPRSGRDPIDIDWLLGHLKEGDTSDAPIHKGTIMGHVHLHVANVESAMRFYHDVMGYKRFLFWKEMGMGDLTLNNYLPHRLAVNSWAGEGAPAAPEGSSGLRHFTIVLPSTESFDLLISRLKNAKVEVAEENSRVVTLRDPSRNLMRLTVG